MKLSGWLAGALGALGMLCAAGCASTVVVPEVLQMKTDSKVYTRYNLWYVDAQKISCLNIQRGRVLPVGTEVVPTRADENNLYFRDGRGTEYRIRFDPGLRMQSMREFILDFLTLESPEKWLTASSPRFRNMIGNGTIAPGMNRREVLLSYGPPPACRTPALTNATWLYWITPESCIRVNFKGDAVQNILNPNL